MSLMIQKLLRGAGVLSLLGILTVLPGMSFAQQAGQGLEISPPLIDLKAKPGDSIETEIRIRNITDQILVARSQYNDFVAGNEEDGNPKLLLEEGPNIDKSPFTIREWITTIPEFTLNPNEQKVMKVSIKVPTNASPGGHYGVIRFTGAPPELDSSSVSLSASIGTLVLITVAGDIKEDAKIAEIYTSQNDKKRALFEYGPVTVNTRFQNAGNVHTQPSGTLTITNMFGKTVATQKFNENKGNVLPQSTRRFENKLDKKLLFGRYNIQADVVYGANNTIVSSSGTFWVIPYKLIIIVLLLLVAAFVALKQYNRFIIKRAQDGSGDGAKADKKKK